MCDPQIVDLSGWSMTVTYDAGREVFLLGFDLKPRPARDGDERRSGLA
jgi:hypothetical protein